MYTLPVALINNEISRNKVGVLESVPRITNYILKKIFLLHWKDICLIHFNLIIKYFIKIILFSIW